MMITYQTDGQVKVTPYCLWGKVGQQDGYSVTSTFCNPRASEVNKKNLYVANYSSGFTDGILTI